MSIHNETPVRQTSRSFLVFLLLLFGFMLCFASFHGGAFGAVQPFEIFTAHPVSHLLIEKETPIFCGSNGIRINQPVSANMEISRSKAVYLQELDRMMAGKRAVDRAA